MRSTWFWPLALAAILLGSCALSLAVGPVQIPLQRLSEILLSGAAGTEADLTIVWRLRLPRILLAVVVGGGLGVAGAGYQGLFRNPLADPFVIGASSGAALGAASAIVYGFQWQFLGLTAVPLAALIGALLAVAAVYGIASIGGEVPTISLLLAGVAVSSFIGALVSLLMFLSDEKLGTIVSWIMGSLSGRGWSDLICVAPLVGIGGACLWLLSRPLDSLAFGEETAASLGVHLNRLRGAIVIAATLMTAAAVSASGIIGFVGLISPHIARALVGARHSYLIPTSGLLGGLMLLAADNVARTAASPGELPVGVVTALLGAPFFLFLLKSRQHKLADG